MINYLGEALFYLFFGSILGIIRGWNKKVMFFIWIGCCVFIVIIGSITGVGNIAGEQSIGMFFYRLLFITLGVFIGEDMYNGIFGKKK